VPIYSAPFVIAEAGCNHMGQMEIAKELIQTAAIFCKADAIKFQKRNNRELLSPGQYNAPHPNPDNSFGNTYGSHREFLEFTLEQHKQLKAWCEEYNIIYSTSVWDLSSAKEIVSLKPVFIKIPSASNNNYEMLGYLSDNYAGEIQVSLGMTKLAEEQEMIAFFERKQRLKDLTVMACTSGYPVPDHDMCLLEIKRILDLYGERVKHIGFSSHHAGLSLDLVAYTLGASVIERHFTLNHYWKGTDHIASLEPDALRRTKRNLMSAQRALAYKKEEMLLIEEVQREKLKKEKTQ